MNAGLLARVEDAGLNASAPPQQRWLDGWLVRDSPGKAKRARCVNALAPGACPLDDKLAECALPRSRAAGFSAHHTFLAQRGWHSVDDTRVMVLDQIDAVPEGSLPNGVEACTVDAANYARAIGALRGSAPAQIDAQAQRVALSPVPVPGSALSP